MLMTSTINTGDDSLSVDRREHSRFREVDLPPGQSSWIMGEEYGRGLWPTTTVGDNSQGRQLGMTAGDNSRGRQSRTTVRRPGCTTMSSVDFTQQSKSGNYKEYNVECNATDSLSISSKRKRRWFIPESTHLLVPRVNSFASA